MISLRLKDLQFLVLSRYIQNSNLIGIDTQYGKK